MMEPNCEACPYKGAIPVPSEGTRKIKKIFEITLKDYKGEVVGKEEVEREVFDSEGQYDIAVVGMAPARAENEQGRPFVGPSGMILRKTMTQMELEGRYKVFNVLGCSIPNSEEGDETSRSDRDQAQECCGQRCIEEILASKPKLVIALGDMPLHLLVDTDYTIKECEGRVLPSKIGVPVLPITHPAFYWRKPDDFFDFIECLRSGVKFLDGSYEQAVEPTLELVTSENLDRVRTEIGNHEHLAVDTETTGFFAYGWDPDIMLEMGLSVDHKHAYIVPEPMVGEFKALLEEKKCIFWNAQFDCSFLKQKGITPNNFFDGMLAHYSLDERPYSHGLKKVARIYLGCDNWEREIEKYIPGRKKKDVSYSVIPTDIRHVYLSKDVTRTFQLWKVMRDEVNHRVFDRLLMPASRMFTEIEERGIRIDPIKMMKMGETIPGELKVLQDKIHELTGEWIEPSSPQQVMELIYDKMEYPIDNFFGRTSSKAYFQTFTGDELLEAIVEYRELSKLKSTYIEGFARFVDRNYRIHPRIKIPASVSGRLASENPSVMNIKSLKSLKEIFIADTYFGYSDVKQNELRWYYLYSGDEGIGDILKRIPTEDEPRSNDPHYLVSRVAYGEERADEMRTQAKAVVFGRLYGRTRASIERQVGSEGLDTLMSTVDSTFPGIKKFNQQIMEKVRNQGYLESFFGRRRRFLIITRDNVKSVEREAVNFPIQSAGSDLMLLNLLNLWEKKDKYGIFPLWPVHDSITFDMEDPGVLPLVKKELEEFSLEVVNGALPFEWDMKYGVDWAMNKERS